MKKKYYILLTIGIIFFFSGKLLSQVNCNETLNVEWARTFGNANKDAITDVQSDNNGNIYSIGYNNSTLNPVDTLTLFIAKYDNLGNQIWIKYAKTGNTEIADYKIAVDNLGNIFAIGSFRNYFFIESTQIFCTNSTNYDIFFLKLSSSGNSQIATKYQTNQDEYAGGIAVNKNNQVIITGTFQSPIAIAGTSIFPYSLGVYDNFIVKLDNDGNYIWNQYYISNSSWDVAGDVTCDTAGNIYVIGKFQGTLYAQSYGLVATNQAEYLLKLNNDGGIIYAKKIDILADSKISRVFVDKNQNAYISYINGTNTFLQRFDSGGSSTLTIDLGNGGTGGFLHVNDIVADELGFFYLAGEFSGTINFVGLSPINSYSATLPFLLKFNSIGMIIDVIIPTYSGTPPVGYCNALCFHKYGNIIIAGSYENSMNFETQILTSTTASDAYFVKIANDFYFGDIIQTSIGCSSTSISLFAEVFGGVPPYSFSWDTGATTQSISGLGIGTFNVIVTDNAGCIISKTTQTVFPSGPSIDLPPLIQTCFYDTTTLNAGNFSDYFWSTGETSQTITVTAEGPYSVTVTDANGCTSSTTVNIQKNPNINLLADTLFFCTGMTTNIYAGDYQIYLWSNGETGEDIYVQNPAEINLIVFDGNCYFLDTIVITEFPIINVSLGPDRIICSGDTAILSTNLTFEEYHWTNGITTSTFFATQDRDYYVYVTDINGCHSSDTVYVKVVDKPNPFLGNDTIVCSEKIILNPINSIYGISYLWSTGSTSNTINVATSGTYWIQITSTYNACVVSDTINVQIYPDFVIDLGPDKDICYGESITFTVDGSLPYILWMTGSHNNSIVVNENEIVYVLTRNNIGCYAEDSVEVTVHSVSTPFLGNDTTLCLGIKYLLKPNDFYDNYLWNTGSIAGNLLISLPGTYRVTVSDDFGCSASDQIVILYEDSPSFADVTENFGNITVTAQNGQAPYMYAMDDINNWQETNAFYNCTEGNHQVYIMDYNKCISDTFIRINPNYRIPSFFTPNNDGFNDTWEIYGFHLFPNAVASVFDRYGKLLFTFKSGQQGWNGTYSGQPVPSDTYWYVVDFGQKESTSVKGSVTIKR
ncbi:MAG: T9SS type B sorting domain-containing protein [Bacteroidales bacterium]|jgi:gliding motility-associated-like protein|nr:T9SS type B sorting domain-containing protein [Bacteroidales bacterium]